MCLSLVSVRVGLEGNRIHDSLVVHQLITFVIGEGVELVVLWITYDLVGFDDLGLARFLEWLLDFFEDVLAHDVTIQLGFAFTIQTESSDFTFHVPLVCGVSIVLRTARHEFYNEIIIQFSRKLAKVIPQDWVGLPLVLQENHGVRVVVQDAFLQLLQGGIEPEPGPTGSETGYKDVEIG